MDKKYRVVFLDLLASREGFVERMGGLGVSPAVVDRILTRAPVIMKGDLTLGQARHYADAVQEAGGRVNIQEDGLFEEEAGARRPAEIKPLEDFTMCPECGFKQLKAEHCRKCGFPLKAVQAGG